jgi:hypothetical protein
MRSGIISNRSDARISSTVDSVGAVDCLLTTGVPRVCTAVTTPSCRVSATMRFEANPKRSIDDIVNGNLDSDNDSVKRGVSDP